jgi:hypothetical protein
MGQVTVKFEGTFGVGEASYSAQEGGHAYAISRAIYYLMAALAKAIVLDHDLHENGSYPDQSGFGRKKAKE